MQTTRQQLEQLYYDDDSVKIELEALLNTYLNSKHRKKTDIIIKAYSFAAEAHKGVRRRSGEPYILHPIAVAQIVVSEIGLGSTSICAALLHDVVEDTDYTVKDLAIAFNPKIAQIVEGLTKISGGVFPEHLSSAQAENFRKLLLTMSEDFRIVIIKIADRLHNMRTLASMPPAKQYKIAGETTYLYAPLAHRLGLFSIKTELEDLSFKFEHPEKYEEISERLKADKAERDQNFINYAEPIKKELEKMDYTFKLKKRVKSTYSIYCKMNKENVTYDGVYDILALRIIFTPKEGLSERDQCFLIYSAITSIYRPHPRRFRDWVSTPKANGYEALHVTVMMEGKWVEIQIRSERMDNIAERGLAAHWKYKTGKTVEEGIDKWVKTIVDVLENPDPDTIDKIGTVRMSLKNSDIFVFTPKGEVKTIPYNATVLDFAFLLHSKIGYHAIAGQVNHNLVALDHKLKSGDQIKILTSTKQHPQKEWNDYVQTAEAANRLKMYFRRINTQLMKEGQKTLDTLFTKLSLPTNDGDSVNKLLIAYNLNNKNELLLQLGKKSFTIDNLEVALAKPKNKSGNVFTNFMRRFGRNDNSKNRPQATKENPKINPKKTYTLNDLHQGKTYSLATCCHPIQGDDVLGYIRENEVIQVHKRNCPQANIIKSNYGNKIVNVEWGLHQEQYFLEKINIVGTDRKSILIDILQIISIKYSVNIKKINIDSQAGTFHGEFEVYVKDTQDLNIMINAILDIGDITSVNRISQNKQ